MAELTESNAYDARLAAVQLMQERLQSTADAEDASVSSTGEKLDDPPGPTAICSGDGGCGGEFPHEDPGFDFIYAMLCSSCYKKTANNDKEENDAPAGSKDKDVADPPGGGTEASQTALVKSADGDTATASSGHDDNDLMTDGSDCGMVDESYDDGSSQGGVDQGIVLINLKDNDMKRYDVICGTNDIAFDFHVNDQDNISKKTRKFWKIIPDTTPLLYGYKHFHALLNTHSKRGWIGHCRLKSNLADAKGNGYVLWEFWETRCDRPRYAMMEF